MSVDLSPASSAAPPNKDLGGHTSDNNQPGLKEQNPANSNDGDKIKKKKCGYPISAFLFENLKEKTALKELIRLYLKTQEYKPTDRAFQKAANMLAAAGLIKLERREQLWLIPDSALRDDPNRNEVFGRKIRTRVHSTHKIKLSIPYKGEQPTDGEEHLFGRNRDLKQYIYHYKGEHATHTVGAFKHKLVIWVRNPAGILTIEQRVNAQAEGYKTLRQFAQDHNISLEGYLEKVALSHHVVENDPLNEALKLLLEKYGKEINERIGTHVCQTSHPGRVEHEGKARIDRIVRGDQVAIGLEKLTLDLPGQFEKLLELQAKNVDVDTRFAKNLELHMQVLNEIRDAERDRARYEKENNETLKAIRDSLKKEG